MALKPLPLCRRRVGGPDATYATNDTGLARLYTPKQLDPEPARRLLFHWQRRQRVLPNGALLGAWWRRTRQRYVDETRERGSVGAIGCGWRFVEASKTYKHGHGGVAAGPSQ